MKALILAYESPGDFAKRNDEAAYKSYMEGWYAFGGSLEKAGVLRGGNALKGPDTATCISIKNGKRRVQDGPFTDTKEQLGGYFLLEVDSLEQATELAKTCPAANEGRVDVRVIPQYAPED